MVRTFGSVFKGSNRGWLSDLKIWATNLGILGRLSQVQITKFNKYAWREIIEFKWWRGEHSIRWRSPGNNAPASDDDINKEIDTILAGSEDDDDDDDDDDDTVVLPKKQVDKLKSDRENYKNGLLSVKDKLKAQKGNKASNADQKKTDKPANAADDDNTPITKADIRKGYEGSYR